MKTLFQRPAWRAIERWLWFILGVRLFAGLLQCFAPLSAPHRWRQVDTLGVALRYWSRWTVENMEQGWQLLAPAVLGSGHGSGIMAMEFPLLNILVAPIFALPHPQSIFAAYFALWCLHLLLIVLNLKVWGKATILDVPARLVVLLFPIFSFMTPYFNKFLPDVTANLLVLLAVGLSWRECRWLRSFFCLALGLLIKPTAILGLSLLLVERQRWRSLWRDLLWVLPAGIITLVYYTAGMDAIRGLGENTLYNVQPKNLLLGWSTFFANIPRFFAFMNFHAFMAYGVIIYFFMRGRQNISGFWREDRHLWLLLALMILFIAGIDGDHALVHSYYFMGATAVCGLLWLRAWRDAYHAPVRWLGILMGLMVLGRAIEATGSDLPWLNGRETSLPMLLECDAIKDQTPQIPWGTGMVFRSDFESYPALGLCFGERQHGRSGEWGFFYRDTKLPVECQPVARGEHVLVAHCEAASPTE